MGKKPVQRREQCTRLRERLGVHRDPGSPEPKAVMKQEREVPGEGQAFCTPPTEQGRPTTSSVGDGLCEGSVCRMPWKWLLPLGSQHGPGELCLPRHSLGHTVVAFLSPWHIESGQALMQNKWLLWDSIPELLSGTSSFSSSSSWESLHGSGDLMSMDQVTLYKHSWTQWTLIEQFL